MNIFQFSTQKTRNSTQSNLTHSLHNFIHCKGILLVTVNTEGVKKPLSNTVFETPLLALQPNIYVSPVSYAELLWKIVNSSGSFYCIRSSNHAFPFDELRQIGNKNALFTVFDVSKSLHIRSLTQPGCAL